MKKTLPALLFTLLSALGVPGGSPYAIAGTAEERMTRGSSRPTWGSARGRASLRRAGG